MSDLSTTLTAAAAEAQRLLAPAADPTNSGEFTIAGDSTTYVGVMEEDPNLLIPTPNGFEKVSAIKIATTRAQFSAAPSAAGRPKLTARGKTWNLTSVTPGAYHYQLIAVIA